MANVKNLENLARLWNYGRSLRGDLNLLKKKTRIERERERERERESNGIQSYYHILYKYSLPLLYNPYQYN